MKDGVALFTWPPDSVSLVAYFSRSPRRPHSCEQVVEECQTLGTLLDGSDASVRENSWSCMLRTPCIRSPSPEQNSAVFFDAHEKGSAK